MRRERRAAQRRRPDHLQCVGAVAALEVDAVRDGDRAVSAVDDQPVVAGVPDYLDALQGGELHARHRLRRHRRTVDPDESIELRRIVGIALQAERVVHGRQAA